MTCGRLSILGLWLCIAMYAQGVTDNSRATDIRMGWGGTPPVSSLPSRSLATRFPDDTSAQTLEFEQRMFGNRNYYIDPEFRAGNYLTVDLPSVNAALDLPTFSTWTDVDIPFIERNLADREALINLGPLRLDAERVTGGMVFTDNARRSKHDRDAEAAAIVAVEDIRALWELTDNIRIALEGDLILLPFEGKMGLNGFGLDRDTFALIMGLDSSPEPGASLSGFRADFSAGAKVGGWDVAIRDSFGVRDFRVRQDFDVYLEEELRMLELGVSPGLRGSVFDEDPDIRGILSAPEYLKRLGTGGEIGDSDSDVSRRHTWSTDGSNTRYAGNYDDDDVNLDFTNTLSLSVSRNAEAQVRPFINVFRTQSKYWYGDEEEERREEASRPTWYEGMTVGLAIDRPSMRFPPYFTYTIARDSHDPEWTKTWRVGIAEPVRISDYITLTANVGRSRRDRPDEDPEENWVYAFTLGHQPRPMTFHSIHLGRYHEEPENRLRTETTYRLSQGLGPYLSAGFVATWTETEEGFDAGGERNKRVGIGGSVRFAKGPFAASFRSIHRSHYEGDPKGEDNPDFLHQIELRYRMNARMSARYQYTWEDQGNEHKAYLDTELYRHKGIFRISYRLRFRDSEDENASYYENLLVLTATRSLKGWSLGQLLGRERKEDDAAN